MSKKSYQIVFFDGDCAFCNKFIIYLIKKDKHDRLRFAHLDSSFAKVTLNNQPRIPDSIILYANEKFYFKSDAILMILKELNALGILPGIFGLIPRKFRDWMYDLFARYRYIIFGKQNNCITPSRKLREKILE
jgi:predicted DCC family thiol-disulfide oxidoreductase YuxK